MRAAGLLLGLALAAAAGLALLIALDGAVLLDDLRTARERDSAWHDPNTRFDAELGWAPIPERHLDTAWGPVTTNAHGYRSAALRADAEAVVVLGDSVAWGFGVGDTDPFAARLDRRLSERGWQVSNLAVSGYGLDQTFLWFLRQRDALPRLRHAILAVCARNDVADTQSNARYGRRKPLFRRRPASDARAPGIELVPQTLRRHSLRHWYTDSRFLRGTLQRWPALDTFARARMGDVLLDRAETDAVIGGLLAALDRETRDRGGRLHVLLLPARDDLAAPSDDYALLRARAQSAGLPVVEVVSALRRASRGAGGTDAVYLDAMHLRPRAHAVVARELLAYLERVDPAEPAAARARARSQTATTPSSASGGPSS